MKGGGVGSTNPFSSLAFGAAKGLTGGGGPSQANLVDTGSIVVGGDGELPQELLHMLISNEETGGKNIQIPGFATRDVTFNGLGLGDSGLTPEPATRANEEPPNRGTMLSPGLLFGAGLIGLAFWLGVS